MKLRNRISAALLTLILALSLGACQAADKSGSAVKMTVKTETQNVSIDNIPDYSGKMYVELNNNSPDFSSRCV